MNKKVTFEIQTPHTMKKTLIALLTLTATAAGAQTPKNAQRLIDAYPDMHLTYNDNKIVFPDGTAWNDALADEYFNGDTFSDYSGHTMKMFFQERGAGASSLNLRFNLPVIESGTFSVEKKLKGTEQQQYANVQFAYQAFLDLEGEDDVPIYPGIILGADGQIVDESSATPDQIDNRVGVRYENTGSTVDFYDNTPIGDSTYDHVFYLKPGESIVFSGIPKDVPYYVREIDVNGSYYDTVMVNEADMGGEGGIPEDTSITAQSSSKTSVRRRT